MDLVQFFSMRMDFVRYFYKAAAAPFAQTIDAIENEVHPFVPVYDESGEPQFQVEWQDAGAGAQAVGLAALSMCSSAFELFLKDWILLRLPAGAMHAYKKQGKEGWWAAYRRLLASFGIDVAQSGVNDALIEQAVLARNRGQHPNDIISNDVRHSRSDLGRYTAPYFVSEADLISSEMNQGGDWWLPPCIHIDTRKLEAVMDEMTRFAVWLDEQPFFGERAMPEEAPATTRER